MKSNFRFLYSENSDLDLDTAPKLLKLAHTYQVTSAVKFCSDYIIEGLSSDNACGFLDIALFYDIPKLRDEACRLIDEQAEKALYSEGFLQVSSTCIAYILKGDTFHTEEKAIFQRAMDWSRAECRRLGNDNPDEQTVRKTLGDAFYYLRVPNLDLSDFVEITRQTSIYSYLEYQELVAQIAGLKSYDYAVNLNRDRLPSCEKAEFNDEEFQASEISCGKVKCSFSLTPNRAFYLTGFEVEHCGISQNIRYGDRFERPSELQKNIVCTVTIDDLYYKETFMDISEPLYFKSPVKVRKNVDLSVEIDFSWLFKYGDSLSRYTRSSCGTRHGQASSGLQINAFKTHKQIFGTFGTIRTKSGNCFVKAFYVENLSHREESPCDVEHSETEETTTIDDENEFTDESD